MHHPLRFALCCFLTLSACKQPADSASAPSLADTPSAITRNRSALDHDTHGRQSTPVLAKLVQLLSTRAEWNSFSAVDGVQWFDAGPVADPDDGATLSRSGKLLLLGLGGTDLPNNKAGADFEYVRGNEGEAGVTLTGNAQSASEIALTKFYPDTDYAAVLARQFDGAVRIEAITTDCPVAYASRTGEQNAGKNVFYRLSLSSGATLYAEGSVVEDGGKYSPGSTVYRFYRDRPVERMDAMRCQAARA